MGSYGWGPQGDKVDIDDPGMVGQVVNILKSRVVWEYLSIQQSRTEQIKLWVEEIRKISQRRCHTKNFGEKVEIDDLQVKRLCWAGGRQAGKTQRGSGKAAGDEYQNIGLE